MSAEEMLGAIRAELISKSAPHKLPTMQRFFKEPIDAYCTYTAHVRNLARTHAETFRSWGPEERRQLTDALWRSQKFEEASSAVFLYARVVRTCGLEEWKLFESWLDRYVSNWANCDALCAEVLGPLLLRHPEWIARLKGWARSPRTYKRRAALAAPLKGVRKGYFRAELAELEESLAGDGEDIVRKAVKWARVELTGRGPKAAAGTARGSQRRGIPESERTALDSGTGRRPARSRGR